MERLSRNLGIWGGKVDDLLGESVIDRAGGSRGGPTRGDPLPFALCPLPFFAPFSLIHHPKRILGYQRRERPSRSILAYYKGNKKSGMVKGVVRVLVRTSLGKKEVRRRARYVRLCCL